MNASRLLPVAACLALAVGFVSAAQVNDAKSKPLLDLSAKGVEQRVMPTYGAKGQVSVVRSQDRGAPGLLVTVRPGKARYPGIEIKPEGAKIWDLSAFGHVEARVVNTGAAAIVLALRVDNEGDWRDNPWNTEQIELQPGASGTVSVVFGYSFGRKPSYALKPAAVVKILMFPVNSDATQSFRVESLLAAGRAGEKPPVDPRSVRIKPKGGVLLGSWVKIDAASQIDATGGAQGLIVARADGVPSLRVVFPAVQGEQSVTLKPAKRRWDLGDAFEVRIALKNEGPTSVTPSVQVVSNGGPTDLITAAAPLAAGAKQEIIVPFAPAVPFEGVHVSKPGNYGGQRRG